jgi:hypothetical protein
VSAADRKRRYQRRERLGLHLVKLEVDLATLALWLEACGENVGDCSTEAITTALQRHIESGTLSLFSTGKP